MTIEQYIAKLNARFVLGNATEHTFRGDLQQLLEAILPEIAATNEPKRIHCGAPDYVLTKNEIPVGYIEAKDIGDNDLEGARKTGNKVQFDRYKISLDNLIFTDYLRFLFYRNGTYTHTICIGEVRKGKIVALPENFEAFEAAIRHFSSAVTHSIHSATRLAEMMADKAKFLANQIEKALDADNTPRHLLDADAQQPQESDLRAQFLAFRDTLVRDLSHQAFADMYAQTIAYGLFAARYHDPTLRTFSREEAAQLIPHSNPFLRKLFQSIAGYDLDSRINYLVDDLVQLFLASDVKEIMQDFGKNMEQEDPVIHFYETFLAKYDPALRKAKGVWYTPQPVVQFMVRAVDEILKQEFDLPQGLADSSKITQKVEINGVLREEEFHTVQVLDPATGTGTFLSEIVRHIYTKFAAQQGIWGSYVENHLLPRLNGFELLMASYAMAHLKLDMLLSETGFRNTKNRRFNIFLTNTLQEPATALESRFENWLVKEANEANAIKRNAPLMVVIGNPPYSVSSSNKSEWIEQLLETYKKGVSERNIQPLSDDYVKFIRFGQHFIEKNGSGVVAYIANNSFLDGIIHRQMRKSLLQTFDKIYILDLHGSTKKKETALDGTADQNVFDIQQGVSINIFVKTGAKPADTHAQVFHFDLYGKRKAKFSFLRENTLKTVAWTKLGMQNDQQFFVNKIFIGEESYQKGFAVNEIFIVFSTGVKTHRDNLVIDINKNKLKNKIIKFYNKDIEEYAVAYELGVKNNRDWNISEARKNAFNESYIRKIAYRIFDDRYCYYHDGLIDFPRHTVMNHMLDNNNCGIIICRQIATSAWQHVWVSEKITDDSTISNLTKERGYHFPLYLYPEKPSNSHMNLVEEHGAPYGEARRPNLNSEIVAKIAAALGLRFTPEKTDAPNTFAPIDVLDYIYAVLHSPTYRETYKEFLKIDFPRVPYPKDAATFWQLAALGAEIRQIHLLESAIVEEYLIGYPIDGENVVGKIKYQDGNVYLNDTQYFSNVPEVAWNFYIGGYQPAQKWLKDRKEKQLTFEDILHYQKIIFALTETHRLMQQIDALGVL